MIVLENSLVPTAPSIVLESDYIHVDPPQAVTVGIDLRYASTSGLGIVLGAP